MIDMSYKFGDLKWSEMSDKQKEKSGGSRSDHMAKRSEAKKRTQSFVDKAAEIGSRGENAADIIARQNADNATTLNNKNTPKGNGNMMSSKNEGYATDKQYRGPDGGMYTGKEADDAGWTPGYYNEGGGAYVPDKQTFKDPHSNEAISARLQYSKDIGKDGKYSEGMKYVAKDDPRRVYDSSSSINEGYDRNLTPGQKGKEWWMGKQYRQDMKDKGISWESGGFNAYDFDGSKGYFVPKAKTRQQRAMEYDRIFTNDPGLLVSDSKRENLGDRYDYIHRTYDPLNGSFNWRQEYT